MAEIGDKVIVPLTGQEGFVVGKDKDFYYVASNSVNSVWVCDEVMVHPDNDGLKEMCSMMCD